MRVISNRTAICLLSFTAVSIISWGWAIQSQAMRTTLVRTIDQSHGFTRSSKLPQMQRRQIEAQKPETRDNTAPQTVKLRLDTSGSRNEWIVIEKRGNTVRLRHTTRNLGFFSRAIDALGVPPLLNFYDWHDHRTTRVIFEPDKCLENFTSNQSHPSDAIPVSSTDTTSVRSSSSTAAVSPTVPLTCTIAGTDSVTLPEGMDIDRGSFTVNYEERTLLRSITFRIPRRK
jgi:hypothetical protein